MSTSKATPGPWKANKTRGLGGTPFWNIEGSDDWSICSFHRDTARSAADADLIAAAPELRDALRELCDYVGPVDYRAPSSGAPKCIRTARALLARLDAEGK